LFVSPIHKAIDKPFTSKLVKEGDRLRNGGDWINAEESSWRAIEKNFAPQLKNPFFSPISTSEN
jgi:hypothetical protein